MTDKTEFELNIERFEKASADLRQAVREAHTVTRDLIHTTNEARRVIKEIEAGVKEMVDGQVAEFIHGYVEDELGPKLRELSGSLYDRLSSQAFEMMNICMYGEPEPAEDAPSIFDDMEERVQRTIRVLTTLEEKALRDPNSLFLPGLPKRP